MSDAPEAVVFNDDGVFPNSPLPLLIYRAAIAAPEVGPEAFEALFRANGWPPQWRDGVFPYHHYHSTAHEALGVAGGTASLELGGPKGDIFRVSAGDALVIPAGVAHRRVVADQDFLLIGAYPQGQDNWDIMRGVAGERPAADRRIAALARPATDPVSGRNKGLTRIWA